VSGDTVLVTSRSFGGGDADPGAWLRERGLVARRGDPGHALELLRPLLADAVGWIAGTARVTGDHLDAAPRLRVLARYGIGVDSVDLDAAARRGIVVTNTPGANAESVADHTLALVLAALRHVVESDADVRAGRSRALRGRELGALTAGVVGFGHVGRAVARRLVGGFGTRVLAHDPHVPPAALRDAGVEPVDLDALAASCDVVSLHLPGGGPPVVDAEFVARMRPAAVLVNTARGDLVDEAAVAQALTDGRLGAAAVDVLAAEPAGSSPLLTTPRTVVTSHLASHTVEAIDRMGLLAAEEVARVLAGHAPWHPVRRS
jgi:D-3-phosphoglycerate dehydrogenase